MLTNRSVPTNIMLAHVTYRDVDQAATWLGKTFGFSERYRYGEPDGILMHLGDAWIMLRSLRDGSGVPAQHGYQTQSLTVFVADVDAHFAGTKTAGATITEDLHETVYGERQYGVEDLDGHDWLFSTHVRDVSPDEWGATTNR